MWFRRTRPRPDTSEILGINRRNLDYVYRDNARQRFALLDDKIVAKQILRRAGLRVPDSIAEFGSRYDIETTLAALAGRSRFVVKPARGFGGAGVKAYRGVEPLAALGVDEHEALAFHMAAILAGMYAMDSLPDKVLVEEFVDEHSDLRQLHGDSGVSDIRIIMSDGTPVMAMLRLPCNASRPTANLHRGGIGVGIDLVSGRTTYAIQRGAALLAHPDTHIPLADFEIPMWREVVEMAIPLNRAFDIRYLGADIVLDQCHGPLILEVNARPGLTIQLANRRGLLGELQRSDGSALRP